MIANYKEYGFEIRARILPEACTACPFYLYSVSCDDAVCFLTGSGIPTDGPQDEGRAPDCPIKAFEGLDEWITHRLPDEWIGTLYKCSKCGHIEEGKPNFCPNCGARMKGADDE